MYEKIESREGGQGMNESRACDLPKRKAAAEIAANNDISAPLTLPPVPARLD